MIKCKTNSQCDFCDARCANYYEETDDYIAWFEQIKRADGTLDYGKIIKYKKPYFQDGKEVLVMIEIFDDNEKEDKFLKMVFEDDKS